jgi:hypothetical protein
MGADDPRRMTLAPFEIMQDETIDCHVLAHGLYRSSHRGRLSPSIAPAGNLAKDRKPAVSILNHK